MARRRRGLTLLELVIAVSLMAVVIGTAASGFGMLSRQSVHAADTLTQTRKVMQLLEEVRLELSSLVMNPFADGRLHYRNSFVISRPHGTSIQFVTERQDAKEGRKRFLVYYEAVNPEGTVGPGPLVLRKRTWEFLELGNFQARLPRGGTWPAEWIGELVEDETRRYQDLVIHDMRWQYLVPSDNEGRVFFRLKVVVAARDGKRLLPYSTLVSVATPDLPAEISTCRCLFAPCFDPKVPDCSCCVEGAS